MKKITITYKIKRDLDVAEVTEEISLNLWKKYGKSRVYINDAEGDTIGYYDITTGEVVSVWKFRRYKNFAQTMIEETGIMPDILEVVGAQEAPTTQTTQSTKDADPGIAAIRDAYPHLEAFKIIEDDR